MGPITNPTNINETGNDPTAAGAATDPTNPLGNTGLNSNSYGGGMGGSYGGGMGGMGGYGGGMSSYGGGMGGMGGYGGMSSYGGMGGMGGMYGGGMGGMGMGGMRGPGQEESMFDRVFMVVER